MKNKLLTAYAAALLVVPVMSGNALNVTVDCGKKASLNVALSKLDRSVTNVVTVLGTCKEDIVVSGHRDLTIATSTGGVLEASNATADSIPLFINGNSRVTLKSLTVTAGSQGVYCDDRSTCVLQDVQITGGEFGGLSVQKQSSADVLGTTRITGSTGSGIGVFGASSVNVGSGVVISGHQGPDDSGSGVTVQDGSFLRTDGVTISGNDTGVFVDRGAVAKVLSSTISGNAVAGLFVRASTVQLRSDISGSGVGVQVGPLSFVAIQGGAFSNNTTNVTCGPTVFVQPLGTCPAPAAP
jgi:hypothetical protein